LGAMVYGGVKRERLQLNEDSLWSGGPQDADNPDARTHLAEIRGLLFAGRYAEAQALTNRTMVCTGPGSAPGRRGHYGSYETLGDLTLEFDSDGDVSAYRRELNLDSAISTVSYRLGSVRFRREVFVSAPAQVLVVRLTCDPPGALTFTAKLDRT